MKLINRKLEDNSRYSLNGNCDIFLEDTTKSTYFFSNNDGGEKNIALCLKNLKNVEIDFGGCAMTFHGRILPIVIDNCENIEIKNFSINYDRPFFSQGDILDVTSNYIDIKIDEIFPYRVENGKLIFTSETWENDTEDCWALMQEFDASRKTLAYNSILRIGRFSPNAKKDSSSPLPIVLFTAMDLGDNTVRLTSDDDVSTFRKGYKLIITHEQRLNPGIAVTDSKNIKLQNIDIIHTGAMGVIAQMTENIDIDNLNIKLFDGVSKGLVSTNCDATHFVNCSGQIKIRNSNLFNMMDDGVNVHGVYSRVGEIDGNTIILEIMHFQQYGVNFYKEGDTIQVNTGHTIHPKGQYIVLNSEMVGIDRIKVKLDRVDRITLGDFVDSITRHPNVDIESTRTGCNRPRGFLLTTRGEVSIKHNYFENSCYGIHIAGDTNYWYESTGVKNVLIEDNYFKNNCVQFGDFSIAITPEFETTNNELFFHENITINSNTFENFVDGLVYARSVNGIKVCNNKYIESKDYESCNKTEKVVFENCTNAYFDKKL